MTAQTQQRMRTSRLLSRTLVQAWPRKETGVLSQRGLLETSLSSSCRWALGFQPDKKPSSEASNKLEFGVGWHDFLDPPFLGHCQLSIWKAWSMDIYQFSYTPWLGLEQITSEKDSLTESSVWDLSGSPSSCQNQSNNREISKMRMISYDFSPTAGT